MNELKQINDYYIQNNQIDWDKIIDDYTPYVNKIISNMANDLSNEDREEIIVDTFFILWKNNTRILLSLDSYIAGIARNLVREKLRGRHITYDITEYENILTDARYNTYIDERIEIVKIEKMFKKLKKIDFDIVNMYYYSAKSMKDIAKELNISEFNVATRLYRIRKKIKKEFNIGG